jgi:hypothetical protein
VVEVYQRFRGSCCLHHQGDIHLRTHLRSYLVGFVLVRLAGIWLQST